MTRAHKQQKTAPAGRGSEANGAATSRRGQRRSRHCILLFFAILANAAPLDLSQWKYRKPIPLTPGDRLTLVELDRAVYTGTSTALADLLVICNGKEVPFALEMPTVHENPAPTDEKILNESVIPGIGLQFMIHRKTQTEHHGIVLATNEKNFRNRVKIETSEDGVEWAVARYEGAIFNFSQDAREFSSMTVEYPVSTRPFIRVIIYGWTKIGAVTAAVQEHKEQPQLAYEVFSTLTPQATEDPESKSTIFTIDQGEAGLPVSRITLGVATPRFQRAALIETSSDGKAWQYLGQHAIGSFRGPGIKEEALTLPVPGAQRFIRLRVYNRNDQPLEIFKVRLEGLVSEIKFFAPEHSPYWLYYGNPFATRAREYDLGAVIANGSFGEIKTPLGSPEPNPAYRPPAPPRKPWSEQHPAILYTVLGGAVLALGIATFRFAARLKPTS